MFEHEQERGFLSFLILYYSLLILLYPYVKDILSLLCNYLFTSFICILYLSIFDLAIIHNMKDKRGPIDLAVTLTFAPKRSSDRTLFN